MQPCRPCCVGPSGFLAVLGLIGVWLKLAALRQSPALIRSTLRSSATQKGSPSLHSPAQRETWPSLTSHRNVPRDQSCTLVIAKPSLDAIDNALTIIAKCD